MRTKVDRVKTPASFRTVCKTFGQFPDPNQINPLGSPNNATATALKIRGPGRRAGAETRP